MMTVKFKKAVVVAAMALAGVACESNRPPGTEGASAGDGYAAAVEKAHGIDAWRGQEVLAADILLNLGGKTVLSGKLLMETTRGRSRIELADGTLLVFDGTDAWVSPASAQIEGARFHLRTWPYFIAAPMKLQDPGSKLSVLGKRQLAGQAYTAARLTFQGGVGDTPDDWYITYAHPQTHRLHAMAYIVTYGKDPAAAEKEPHLIMYEEFETIDGVSISTRWRFWPWSPEQGSHGDPIGDVSLSNVEFVKPTADGFARPDDARPDILPPTK